MHPSHKSRLPTFRPTAGLCHLPGVGAARCVLRAGMHCSVLAYYCNHRRGAAQCSRLAGGLAREAAGSYGLAWQGRMAREALAAAAARATPCCPASCVPSSTTVHPHPTVPTCCMRALMTTLCAHNHTPQGDPDDHQLHHRAAGRVQEQGGCAAGVQGMSVAGVRGMLHPSGPGWACWTGSNTPCPPVPLPLCSTNFVGTTPLLRSATAGTHPPCCLLPRLAHHCSLPAPPPPPPLPVRSCSPPGRWGGRTSPTSRARWGRPRITHPSSSAPRWVACGPN